MPDTETDHPLSRDLNIDRESQMIVKSLTGLYGEARLPSPETIAKIIRGEKVTQEETHIRNKAWLEGYVKGWTNALA